MKMRKSGQMVDEEDNKGGTTGKKAKEKSSNMKHSGEAVLLFSAPLPIGDKQWQVGE